jgi:replicative DNA helicase
MPDEMKLFENDLRPMPYWTMIAENKLAKWARGEAEGYSTGFAELDKYFRLVNSEMITIAARPSMGKCLGKGTKVLMYDGSLRAVEHVNIGDRLMGPDSKPRNVLSLARGHEMMYWIHQSFGMSYRVNESHVISLKRSKNEGKWAHGDVLNISVAEAKDKGPGFFSRWKGYKVQVEFPHRDLPLDPYFLGIWLGDGSKTSCKIYNTDREVIDYLHEYADSRQEYVIESEMDRPCSGFLITGGRSQASRDSSVRSTVNRLGLLNDKRIPRAYLVNSTSNRLQLLAGLLDSDGYYAGHYDNGQRAGNYYEITQKNKALAEDIKFLADSLGFRTSISPKKATINSTGYESTVYRVRFAGDVDRIPCLIERKRARPWTDFRDWTMSGIRIESDKVDEYYGFVIDGDHLFLLEDMTVTHNTILGMQMAENVAHQIDSGCIAIFSAEMTGWSLVVRMAGAMAGVNTHKMRMGQGDPDDMRKLQAALSEIKRLPIWIDDGSSPSTKNMLAQLEDLHKTNPIRMMLFDFMELGGDRAQSEELRVGAIAIGLKDIAKKLNIPVVALSQLNRGVEDRANKMPGLADLRYSGQVEQVSDVVAFIMRPEYYAERGMTIQVDDKNDLKGVAYISIGKNRQGPVGNVKMAFVKQLNKFADLAR